MLRHKRLKINLENSLKYTARVWHTYPKKPEGSARRPQAKEMAPGHKAGCLTIRRPPPYSPSEAPPP